VATKRANAIIPLTADGLDKGRRLELMREISEREGVSTRTLSRYVAAWNEGGYEALKPKRGYSRADAKRPANWDWIVEEAIGIRRELPGRSVKDIIKILELEEAVTPGSVKRSTLQRWLQAKGYSASRMSMYSKTGAAARRFQKQHRMALLQSDVKFGPRVPLTAGGKPEQIYLTTFIDDATRYIVGARFYDNQGTNSLEDCFRRAVQSYGAPDACYVDRGSQYRSDWFGQACAKIGTKLLKAKPYHPEGKGKVERFNREISRFLAELALAKPRTIDDCNDFLAAWVEEDYQKSEHSGIDGIMPLAKFHADSKPLRFVPAETLKDAFLHTDTRKVDKTGCVSFDGGLYEVGLAYAGLVVALRFDPAWKDEIEFVREGAEPKRIKRLEIGENCGVKQELPEWMKQTPPGRSRLLDGLKARRDANKGMSEIATSFKELWEGKANV